MFEAIPERIVELTCGGDTHRVTWCRGELRLEDHDLEAERTAEALGAEPPPCVELFEAWPFSDYEVEALDLLAGWYREDMLSKMSRREMEDQLKALEAQLPTHIHNPAASLASARKGLERKYVTWLLSGLPEGLKDCLALHIVAACAEDWWDDVEFREVYGRRLEHILAAKVVPAVEEGMATAGRRLGPRTTVACWLAAPGVEPSLEGWGVKGGAGAAVTVPPTWLVDVWARGLALVEGCFVLDVISDDDGHMAVQIARWEHREGRILPVVEARVIRRTAERWTLLPEG